MTHQVPDSNPPHEQRRRDRDRCRRAVLARECAKLDPIVEQALAEEGMAKDFAAWPEY